MGKCVVKKCTSNTNSHGKASGISFHKIPKDPERLQKWIKIIRILRKETDWLPTEFSTICSNHFRDEDKLSKTAGSTYLSHDAVPILNDNADDADDAAETQIEDLEEDIENITYNETIKEMKKKVEHLKTVADRRLRKINTMKQKIKRLQIKNEKLRDVIKNLNKNVIKPRRLIPTKKHCH